MAVAFDAGTDGGNNGGSTSSLSFSHTCTGSGRLLVVHIAGDSAAGVDDLTGVTYASVAMTLVGKVVAGVIDRMTYEYHLENPASGTNTVAINASSSHYIIAGATSYTGVNASGQPDASTTGVGTDGQTTTLSLTTVANNCWTVLTVENYHSNFPANAGTGSTARVSDGSFGTWNAFDSNGPITPAGSYTMSAAYPGAPNPANNAGIMASFAPIVSSFSSEMAQGLIPTAPRLPRFQRQGAAEFNRSSFATFSPEMALGSRPPLRSTLPKHDRQGVTVSQPTPVIGFTSSMTQGQRPDQPRLFSPRTLQAFGISQTTHVVAPFVPSMSQGWGHPQPRLPGIDHSGQSVAQPTPVLSLSPEMTQGVIPDLLTPRQPNPGQIVEVNSPDFSFESVLSGYHDNAPRLPVLHVAPVGIDSQLTPVAVFSPEMTQGSHPDLPVRNRLQSGLTVIVDSPVFPFESILGGWRPDSIRLPLLHRGTGDSQLTSVLVLSPEMVAGSHSDQPRPPFRAPIGWTDSQLTPVLVLSPEMLAGSRPDRPVLTTAKQGFVTFLDTPLFSFESVLAGTHPDSPRLPFGAKLGWLTLDPAMAATFSPEMVLGSRPSSPTLPKLSHAGIQSAQTTPVLVVTPEMLQGVSSLMARLPNLSHAGWQQMQAVPTAVPFSPEMILGSRPLQGRVFPIRQGWIYLRTSDGGAIVVTFIPRLPLLGVG